METETSQNNVKMCPPFLRVKKSGLNTTESQDAPEQSYGNDSQYAAADYQYPTKDDEYGTTDEQYPAENNQYAPEDTEYSEEYQFT